MRVENADRVPVLLESMPANVGPIIGKIVEQVPEAADATVTDAEATTPEAGGIRRAEAGFDADLVFSLALQGEAAAPQVPEGVRVLPVAPLKELGSQALAEASGSLADILDALADDVAILPVGLDEQGEIRPIAFTDPGTGLPDLHIYSSAEAYCADRHGTEGLFVIRHGAVLVDYVVSDADSFHQLVIDSAPDKEEADAIDVFVLQQLLVMTQPPLGEDEADAAGEGEDWDDVAARPARPAAAYVLDLPSHWATIDLTANEAKRKDQIQALVKKQTVQLSDAGAQLRHEMRTWLARTASDAAAQGGREFAFLVARTNQAAAALNVVTYWHSVGTSGKATAFELLEQKLRAEAGPEDDLVLVETADDRLLRHTRTVQGATEVGGGNTPLLMADYWLEVPGDPITLAHLVFTTPHLFARKEILELCDAVALGGSWFYPEEN